MKTRQFVWVALLALTLHETVPAQNATIVADLDNTLYYDAAGAVSNGLGTQMAVGTTNGRFGTMVTPRRGLVRFNVLAFVPPGATIVTADLTMSASKTVNGQQG